MMSARFQLMAIAGYCILEVTPEHVPTCFQDEYTNILLGRMMILEQTSDELKNLLIKQQTNITQLENLVMEQQNNNSHLLGIVEKLNTTVTELKVENMRLNYTLMSLSAGNQSGTLETLLINVLHLYEDLNTTKHQIHEEPVAVVAFIARLSSPTTLASQEVLVFDEVLMNTGNGYNRSSGVFVAPVSGYYLFSVSVLSKVNQHAHLMVMKNNTIELDRFYTGSGSASGSVTVVVDLEENNKICVKQVNGATGHVSGSGYSSFMGVLLNAN